MHEWRRFERRSFQARSKSRINNYPHEKPSAAVYLVELQEITKAFGGVKANDRVTVRVRKGDIHALVGENGAGKSTLMKILYGMQQRVEILKILYRRAELLILDEPTPVLTPQEVEEFFTTIRRLKTQGKTVILITHKLNEVMTMSDRVTVMRRGKVVGELETAS